MTFQIWDIKCNTIYLITPRDFDGVSIIAIARQPNIVRAYYNYIRKIWIIRYVLHTFKIKFG